MRPRRRRWTLRWLIPALAALTIAAPVHAYPVTEERHGGGSYAPDTAPSPIALHPDEFLQPAEAPNGFGWLEAALLTSGAFAVLVAAGAGARLVFRHRPASLPAGV